jgi:hypothetical protein
MKSSRIVTALSLAVALFVAGCDSVTDPSNNQTVTLSGTIPVQGVASPPHNFSVSKNGEFRLRVLSLAPNNAVLIGVYLGQPAGAICNQAGSITTAGINTTAMSGPVNRGNYCIGVLDPGTLSTATNYSIELSHP